MTGLITLNKFLALFDHQLLPMSNGKFTTWQGTLGTYLASNKCWFPLPLLLYMVLQNLGEQRWIGLGPSSQFHSLVRGPLWSVSLPLITCLAVASPLKSYHFPFCDESIICWKAFGDVVNILFLTDLHSGILGSRNNFLPEAILSMMVVRTSEQGAGT